MNMRDEMPVTAAWIDKMREVFGKESVDSAIRRGMKGHQGFHATENGHEVGTPIQRGVRIGRDERGNMVNLDDPHAPSEPYGRRVKAAAEWAAREQAEMNNDKGQGDGT